MTNPPGFRYKRAPIVEVVLDVQVEVPTSFDLERLALLAEDDYQSGGQTIEMTGHLTAGPLGLATKTSQRANGYRYTSVDGRHNVLMRDNGFTFGEAAPYDTWDAFSTEAYRMWGRYVELACPSRITRFGLRYINQITPPAGEVDLAQYLRTRLEISEDLPQTTVGYFLSFDSPLPDHNAMSRVTETIVNTDDGRLGLVLDIDVFREAGADPADDGAVRVAFATLRDAKNLIFEASITDDARRLFD